MHCYACPVTVNSTHTANTPPQYDTQATSDLTVAWFVTKTPAAVTSSVRKHNPQLSLVQYTVMEALRVMLHSPSFFNSIKWDFWRTHSFFNREIHTHPKVTSVSLSSSEKCYTFAQMRSKSMSILNLPQKAITKVLSYFHSRAVRNAPGGWSPARICCGGHSGTGTGFSHSTSVLPLSIAFHQRSIPIYHWRYTV